MSTHRCSRGGAILACVLLGAATFVAQSWLGPAPARADGPLITCKETGTVSWLDLGVGAIPGTITWNTTKKYTDCKGSGEYANGPFPRSSTSSGAEQASCNGVSGRHGTGILVWSDNTSIHPSTSKIEIGQGPEPKPAIGGDGHVTIKIVSGYLSGHTADDLDTVTVSGKCPGVEQATTIGTFSIT